LGLHVTRQARRLARRLASHTGDARLPALHRGDFGLRSRASLTGIASGSVTASSSRPGRSARRAGSRTSRGGGCESPPRDATPRSVFRCASRTRPLVSKAGMFLLRSANRSQEKNALCSTKKLAVSEGRRLALTQAASSSPPARDSFKTKAWGCLSRSVRPSPIEPAILGRLPCAAQGETVRRRNGSLRTQPLAMPLLQRITSCCAAPGKRAAARSFAPCEHTRISVRSIGREETRDQSIGLNPESFTTSAQRRVSDPMSRPNSDGKASAGSTDSFARPARTASVSSASWTAL